MLTMFTALEARATAYLADVETYSIYLHIEQRILDTVQHGGTTIVYAGRYNNKVIDALRALGYEVTRLQYEGKDEMIRVDWTNIMCPDSLVCPKEIKNDKQRTNFTQP